MPLTGQERERERERDTAVWAMQTGSQLALINSPTNHCRSIRTLCNDRHRKSTRWGVPCWWKRHTNTCRICTMTDNSFNLNFNGWKVPARADCFLFTERKWCGFAFCIVDIFSKVRFSCLSITCHPPTHLFLCWHVKGTTTLMGLISRKIRVRKWHEIREKVIAPRP